jgi:hypothetical protein
VLVIALLATVGQVAAMLAVAAQAVVALVAAAQDSVELPDQHLKTKRFLPA